MWQSFVFLFNAVASRMLWKNKDSAAKYMASRHMHGRPLKIYSVSTKRGPAFHGGHFV